MKLAYINGYELMLPDHRAKQWEEWNKKGGWEKKRIDEMISDIVFLKLSQSKTVVFDIGSEASDISALLVSETGCDIVLFEPTPEVWSCAKQTFEANKLQVLVTNQGFLCNEDSGNFIHHFGGWPACTDSPINPDHGFCRFEERPDIPKSKLDTFCKITNVYPDVITIDVEGAEFEVLKGAEIVLKEKSPVVFLSLHPEFMYIHYKQWVAHLFRFMSELGYKWECIEYELHECHLKFTT